MSRLWKYNLLTLYVILDGTSLPFHIPTTPFRTDDLHHDGHLFSSSKGFPGKAQQINNYLEEWNAVGFRSAFMLRNLEWIQELNKLSRGRGQCLEN